MALSLALSSNPALAGKKKEKEADTSKGGLYRPVQPNSKPSLILDTTAPTVALSKSFFAAAQAPQAEPAPPVLSRVVPVGTMRIRSLFE